MNKDLTSLLGYVMLHLDTFHNVNVLHNISINLKHMTKSVLAAEKFAAAMAFNYVSTLRVEPNSIFERIWP